MEKVKFLFLSGLLSAMTFSFSACSEDEEVRGDMPYKSEWELKDAGIAVSPNSHAVSLSTAVQTEINELETKYNKNWTVSYLGASVDEALAAEDQKALSGFDDAVSEMKTLATAFDNQVYQKDYAGGSFKYTYTYIVSRDKILKESEPIIFEYNHSKMNFVEINKAFTISASNPDDYNKDIDIDLTEALQTTGLQFTTITVFSPENEQMETAFILPFLVDKELSLTISTDAEELQNTSKGLWYIWIKGTDADKKPGAIKVSFTIAD